MVGISIKEKPMLTKGIGCRDHKFLILQFSYINIRQQIQYEHSISSHSTTETHSSKAGKRLLLSKDDFL